MLYYLAAPYSDNDPFVVQHRLLLTARAAGELFKRDIHCFAPTIMCHQMKLCTPHLDGSFDTWKSLNYRMLDLCDGLLVLNIPGAYRSVGVGAEVNYCYNRKPIQIVDPNNYTLLPFDIDILL